MAGVLRDQQCSQWGTYPGEQLPDHQADGTAIIVLTQYDPPETVIVPMCRNCVLVEWANDDRITWVDETA